jgi:phosphoserine aminotransferase
MISFYPGPSRVYDTVPRYVKDAHKKGILSINHRSDEFMKIAEHTITLLKKKLHIPGDYTIFFTSSATECWEIIAQSLVTKKSYHVYNGAFGHKWFEYTKRIQPGAKSYSFKPEEEIVPQAHQFSSSDAVICITQNETSNGTQVSNKIIRALKEGNPGHLIAVDATSSLGGIQLDIESADIWLASVQKCFGLPAGLGLMICSARAIRRMKAIDEKNHYNSLTFMHTMMEKWQTPYTPNVLGIYLLMRVMEDVKTINVLDKKLRRRYKRWIAFLKGSEKIHHLIPNKEVQSYTVIPVTAEADRIDAIKKAAKKKGILLGEGYGDLKSTTFRIANFPAIKKTEIETLQSFLKSFL